MAIIPQNNRSFTDNFFKNDKGKVVIWQMPNIPLIGWALTRILLFINTNQKYQPAIRNLSSAFLFTWAYLEITQGVNYFRRTAGAVVMVLVLIGILKS